MLLGRDGICRDAKAGSILTYHQLCYASAKNLHRLDNTECGAQNYYVTYLVALSQIVAYAYNSNNSTSARSVIA
jgi:hypothetical protein